MAPKGGAGGLGLLRPITGNRHRLSVYSRWSLSAALFVLWQREAPLEALGGQGSQSFCRSRQLIGGPLVGLLDGSSRSASLRRPVPALSPHDRGGNGQMLKLAVVLEMRPDWTEFLLWDAAWLAFKYYGSPFNLVPRPSDSSPSSRSARLHHTLLRLRDSESTVEAHAGAGPPPTPPR